MGSLKCPLCCRAEFPNRRALQQHLLDVLDLLKCPTCSKSFTSILGLVQHLSLSSCNVEVGVNFDEHFVTYVDCSFMKQSTSKQEKVVSEPASSSKSRSERPVSVQNVHGKVQSTTSTAAATSSTTSQTLLASLVESEVIIPDLAGDEEVGVVIECASGENLPNEEIICINLEPGLDVLDAPKVLQTKMVATPSQVDRVASDSAKKIAVPNKRKGPQTSIEEPSENLMDERNVTYIYRCELCSQRFLKKDNFEVHECTGTSFTCDVCGTIRKSSQALNLHRKLHEREDLERRMNEPSTETIECEQCGETIGLNMAEVHAKAHSSGLRTFSCKLCSNKYLSMSKLNEHLISSHGDNRAYSCETCGKEFKTLGYLKAHEETHSVLKKFPCSYCNKSYHRKWDMMKHEYIHTGEKPVACEICGKRFRVQYCLKIHMRTHTDERPYECGVCHKRFRSQAVYSHHIKLHGDARPYQCPRCPKSFKNLVALSGHRNRHEKPYSCDVCGRRFPSKYDVKVHMPIHNSGRDSKELHRCLVCDAVYARHHALVEHLKEHENSSEASAAPAEVKDEVFVVTEVEVVEDSNLME